MVPDFGGAAEEALRTHNAGTGFFSYPEAVHRMNEIIINASRDPELMTAALQILRRAPAGFYESEAQRLLAAVQGGVRYMADTFNEDIYRNPALTLRERMGDCDDLVLLLASLARAVGFPVRLVYVWDEQPDELNGFPMHVYMELDTSKGDQPGGRWVAMEPTPVPEPGSFRPRVYLALGETFQPDRARTRALVMPGQPVQVV
jgi:transglutaminase-like putative cysteine protease